MGFSRQEYWSRLPFSPPEDLSDQGWNPRLLCLLHYSQILNPLSHLGSQLYLQMQKHICKFSYLISFGKNIKTDFQGASESDFSQVWLTYHIFFLNFIIIFLIFNWTIVDLKCCVSYCCKAMWISYTYTYIHFFRFFSHIDHDRAPITCLDSFRQLTKTHHFSCEMKAVLYWDNDQIWFLKLIWCLGTNSSTDPSP